MPATPSGFLPYRSHLGVSFVVNMQSITMEKEYSAESTSSRSYRDSPDPSAGENETLLRSLRGPSNISLRDMSSHTCSCGHGTASPMSLLYSSGKEQTSSTSSWRRVILCLGVSAAALTLLLLGLSAHVGAPGPPIQKIPKYGPAAGKDVLGVQEESVGKKRVTKRVLIRDKTDQEGLGSQLNHIKSSMILAKALDATFILGESASHHQYGTSHLLNNVLFADDEQNRPPVYLPLSRACLLSDHLAIEDRAEVLAAYCDGTESDKRIVYRVAASLEKHECNIIVDNVGRDFYAKYNGCYRDVLRERLGGMDGRRNLRDAEGSGDAGALTIGIHIRWGDTSKLHEQNTSTFRGSMPQNQINEVINDAQKRFKRLDIRLAMENHDDEILRGFEFDYELIDSGDMMADMHALADNDLLLFGTSSFAILTHLLAPDDGLTIVAGTDREEKFANSGRDSISLEDVEYEPSMLDSLTTRYPAIELI